MARRAVVVHSLEQAQAAVAAARNLQQPLCLASAPGAAAYTGALWFCEVVRLAAVEAPEIEVTGLLDCGADAGLVLAAFRQGLRQVRYSGPRTTASKLAEIATAYGAELVTGHLQALDLLDHPEPQAACTAWLSRR